MRASDFQEGVPSKIRPLDSQKKMGPEHLPYRTHLLGGAKGLNVCVVHQNFPARAPQSFRDIGSLSLAKNAWGVAPTLVAGEAAREQLRWGVVQHEGPSRQGIPVSPRTPPPGLVPIDLPIKWQP